MDRGREGPWPRLRTLGAIHDSDNFPTEARGSLAVPAVACRSGRSVAVAKTDRLRSNQFQQGISEHPELRVDMS